MPGNNSMVVPSEWFRSKCKPHCMDEREIHEKWTEYCGYRDDGYPWSWISVRLGFSDPPGGE